MTSLSDEAAPKHSRRRKDGQRRLEMVVAALVVPVVLVVALVSQIMHPPAAVHQVAQFAHLACVVIGFGSVLAVDWFGLRWTLSLTSLDKVLSTAGALAMPTWLGLAGLLLSGMLLEPDLSGLATQVKLVLVAGTALVGINALATKRLFAASEPDRPGGLVIRAMVLAVVSQACWWGAAVIGFMNRTT